MKRINRLNEDAVYLSEGRLEFIDPEISYPSFLGDYAALSPEEITVLEMKHQDEGD